MQTIGTATGHGLVVFPRAQMGQLARARPRTLDETINALHALRDTVRAHGGDPAQVLVTCEGDVIEVLARKEEVADRRSIHVVIASQQLQRFRQAA